MNAGIVGVREQSPGSGIETLDVALARRYLADGTFVGGMAPKMESIVRALEGGARRAVACGSGPGALSAAVIGNGRRLSQDSVQTAQKEAALAAQKPRVSAVTPLL